MRELSAKMISRPLLIALVLVGAQCRPLVLAHVKRLFETSLAEKRRSVNGYTPAWGFVHVLCHRCR